MGAFPAVKLFIVECRTGCSCCSSENHYRGPYSSEEIAKGHVERFREMPLLSSQYSKTGNYHIREEAGELLPDGRVISDSKVYAGFKDDGDDDVCGRAD